MLIEDVAKLSPLDRFLYWIRERHQIHLKRKAGMPKPWTNDQVLQSYFFTNPYRENDKVTVWFRENIREPLRNDSHVLMATVIFRWFNLPETGTVLLGYPPGQSNLLLDWNKAEAIKRLDEKRKIGMKIFTGAFNISNSGSTKPKINRVCEDYIQPAWEHREKLLAKFLLPMSFGKGLSANMQEAHYELMKLPGLRGSGFMAYEVVCDLRYTYLLEHAPDKCSWSNPGPGAKRGLNRLLGRPLEASVKDWPEQSMRLLNNVQARLSKMPAFEMREVEHSLCEWDKYERARLQDGHMKRRYAGA